MKEDLFISVVIPAYNEEGYIGKAMSQTEEYMSRNFTRHEIIVVDDGSRDRTCAEVHQFADGKTHVRILENGANKGKGLSIKKGVLSTSGDYVLFTDADMSTPIDELDKFKPYLREGKDIIIGSRALKESDIIKKQNIIRGNMGRIFNLCVQLILFRGIKDTQCGFKCFKRTAMKKIFDLQRIEGFCFDAELLFIAKQLGLSVVEVPIRWINRHNSRVSCISDSSRMFMDLIRIRWNSWKGLYESQI